MRIATWNVNSLNVRLPRVEEWLAYAAPDVLCMQETKLADEAFPTMAFAAAGYEVAFCGEGRWNGVAIASRVGISDVVAGFSPLPEEGPTEARLVSATCGGVRVASLYVPNGRSLDSEHYQRKLQWLARIRHWVEARHTPSEPLALCGDFNIAPDDRDVYEPAKFVGATHVSAPEREALGELLAWGLADSFRLLYDEPGLFTWWDYRAGDFHQGRGLRIDLLLMSEPLAKGVTWGLVDRNARKGKSPSDHAPVLIDLDWGV
ncbi:MAG: exodeoxyribonuclease III [Acidimicrobiia bacterium]